MSDVIARNASSIQNLENQTLAHWNQENFYDSGLNLGEIELIFDIASDNNPPALQGLQRDDTAPAQFAAGFYYSVSSEEKTAEILKCF